MAVEVLKQFAVSFSALIDNNSFETAENRVTEASETFMSVTSALGAALLTGSFAMALRATADRFDALGDAASRMGNVTVEELDRIGYVAEMAGSDAQTAQASIENLSRSIGEAANGVGRGAQAFEKFGLSAKNSDGSVKSVSQVLEDVREKLDGLSEAEQSAMIQRLGMDRTMLEMLTSDTSDIEAEYEKRTALLGINADEVAEISGAFNDGIGRMSRSFNDVFTAIAVRIMPAVTDVFETFSKWILENGDKIIGVISPFVKAFEIAIRVVRNGLEVVLNLASSLGPIPALIAAIVAGIKAFNLVMSMSPIGRIVAGISALVSVINLLIDDFQIAMKGGKSFFSFWVPLVNVIRSVSSAIASVPEVISDAFETVERTITGAINTVTGAISGFFDYLGQSNALSDFTEAISNAFGFVESIVQTFSGTLQTLLGGVLALFTGNTELLSAAWNNLFDGMTGIVENFVSFFSNIFSGIGKTVRGVLDLFGFGDDETEKAQSENSLASSSSVEEAQGQSLFTQEEGSEKDSPAPVFNVKVQGDQSVQTQEPEQAKPQDPIKLEPLPPIVVKLEQGLNAASSMQQTSPVQAVAPSVINNQNTSNTQNTTNNRTLTQTINVSSAAEAKEIAVYSARVYGGAQ